MKRAGQKLLAILLILSFIIGDAKIVWAEGTQETISDSAEFQDVSQKELQIEVKTQVPDDLQSGKKVVLYAQASGGAGEYQYQFVDGDGQVLQDYSTVEEFIFEVKEGQNQVVVKVKDQFGNLAEEKYEVFVDKIQNQESETNANFPQEESVEEDEANEKKFSLESETQDDFEDVEKKDESNVIVEKALEETLKVNIESTGTAQEYVDRKVVLTGKAEGGSGNYQYRFTEIYNGKEEVLQDYSVNNIYEFTTKGIGKHVFLCKCNG